VAKRLFESLSPEQQKQLERMKERFNSVPLHDLLVYVYARHPESITKSKIRKKILKNSMFGAIPDLPEFHREREDFREFS
jgi:inosine-uridine nucleoside N-ribohydrolase